MKAANFAEFITQERARLAAERERLVAERDKLNDEIVEIDRQAGAITAYEDALKPRAARTRNRSVSRSSGTPRGGRRTPIMEVLRRDGPLPRGTIIERLGLDKANDSHANGVSNALRAMVRDNEIVHNPDGTYAVAA